MKPDTVTRQTGFTLLEILVVLSLLGVLLGLVGAALVGANRATAKAERFSTRLDEVRAAQGFCGAPSVRRCRWPRTSGPGLSASSAMCSR